MFGISKYYIAMRKAAHIFLATLLAFGIIATNVSAYEFCLTACCSKDADMGQIPMGEVILNDLPHECCGGSANSQCSLNNTPPVVFKCKLASSQPEGYRAYFSSTNFNILDINVTPINDRAVLQATTPVSGTLPIFIQNLAFLC